MEKVELLAPAGSLNKLKYAFLYGADAVYIGGGAFSLRAAAGNFTTEEIARGVAFAHDRGGRVYVAVNTFPRGGELSALSDFAREIHAAGADAAIVADLGAFSVIRQAAPDLPIHISTQANVVNPAAAALWRDLGAKRVVLARELNLGEISEISRLDIETEVFVHGAMCVSYSGRCLLSNYMANRDANRGECAQPCRWKYSLVEEKRPGEYFPIEEGEGGAFIMNSRDLCMIEHLGDVIKTGVKSLKIEGRVKSEYYVATVVKAYRNAIDAYYEGRPPSGEWLSEVGKVSHRQYGTGFFYGEAKQIYETSSYIREYTPLGIIKEYDAKSKMAKIEQRNRFFKGDIIEVLPPTGPFFEQRVEKILDERGEEIPTAPHPKMVVNIPLSRPAPADSIIRKASEA